MNKIQTFVFILSIFLSIEAIHAQINNNMDKSIIISTSEDLYQLACKVNQGNSFDGVHIKLANDLLLNDTTGWQQWKKETPGSVHGHLLGMLNLLSEVTSMDKDIRSMEYI